MAMVQLNVENMENTYSTYMLLATNLLKSKHRLQIVHEKKRKQTFQTLSNAQWAYFLSTKRTAGSSKWLTWSPGLLKGTRLGPFEGVLLALLY
jgi:hypothetical protein